MAGECSKLPVEQLPMRSGDESDEVVEGEAYAPVESCRFTVLSLLVVVMVIG